jgi:DNA-binding winged helix-turn-helix (wHTH) protein
MGVVNCGAVPSPEVYQFGPYHLDASLSRLACGHETITIPPKTFDLLLLLVRNHHRVIPKTEVIETLWPNTFVDEGNLTQHVYTLRKALGDRPDGQPYIETVPRRGYRLAAEVRSADTVAPVDTAAPLREGERKRATVLQFAIANLGTLAEHLGANEMQQFIEQARAAAREEIDRYGGVVTQALPDGLIAVFGAREVHEDDARRAVLAARGITRRVAQMAPPLESDGDRVATCVGLATGALVINQGNAPSQYTAVGEAVRTAALLQQFGGPGLILVDESTARAVQKHFVTEAAGHVGHTAAFRVSENRSRPQQAAEGGRTLAGFVGRERERFLLDGLFAQVLSGSGHAVTVVGEPGVGKSRLVAETTRGIASQSEPVTVLEGRCVSYGSLVPYLPMSDLVRSHCSVTDADAPDVVRNAVEAAIREHGLPRDTQPWLLRLIGLVDEAGDALSPEAIKRRTFDALRALLLKAAVRRPLVVIVEDVHWIDRTSEEFLATLVAQLTAARLFLIATSRPGYRPPWMDRSYVTQVTIAPLNAGDSARLLQAVSAGQRIDADVSSAILKRGEGNPFFLEELALAVLAQADAATAIPETVQGVIMARLDRLPDAAKRLLQTASVLGREVPLRVLSRVWEEAAPFDAEIGELCRQEFLYERPGADETVYVFKHALTQDVAYDSLLARRRRQLHLLAARAIEALHADRVDEVAATVAYHYARTDLIDEAATWLVRAASQAARVYANAEAILHLDLAARRLQRLPEGPLRDRRIVDVALAHAHSLYFLGRFARASMSWRPMPRAWRASTIPQSRPHMRSGWLTCTAAWAINDVLRRVRSARLTTPPSPVTWPRSERRMDCWLSRAIGRVRRLTASPTDSRRSACWRRCSSSAGGSVWRTSTWP